jgi:hypothetical protein
VFTKSNSLLAAYCHDSKESRRGDLVTRLRRVTYLTELVPSACFNSTYTEIRAFSWVTLKENNNDKTKKTGYSWFYHFEKLKGTRKGQGKQNNHIATSAVTLSF